MAPLFVKNNKIYNNGAGIATMLGVPKIFYKNEVYGNRTGIGIGYDSNHNTIADNKIHNNDTGLDLDVCGGNSVINNYVYNNKQGIRLSHYSWLHIITRNNIYNNNIGLTLEVSPANEIYNNNFISNVTNVYGEEFGIYPHNYGKNVFSLSPPTGGNYWYDWTTPDANCDGFVDVPYVAFSGITKDDKTNFVYQDDYPWAIPNGWLTPKGQLDEILKFYNISSDDGYLIGNGQGYLAKLRLNALRTMLWSAGKLIERGYSKIACQILNDVCERTDGNSWPTDYVKGEATFQLTLMIQGLRKSLGCR